VLELYSGMLNRLPSWSLFVQSKYVYVCYSLSTQYFNQVLDYTHLIEDVRLLAHGDRDISLFKY
jgi:hypothetical protein